MNMERGQKLGTVRKKPTSQVLGRRFVGGGPRGLYLNAQDSDARTAGGSW